MRIRQLDGVRALAVLMVFAEHGVGLKMGWAGVDLFFVLSGFLITRILRSEREKSAYWSRFYIKRAARIIPALALCLVICALYLHLQLHKLWLAYIFFGANFAAAFSPNHGVLEVLWSLAVEEHFYLFWPVAVRFLDRRQLVNLLITILILEPVLRAAVTPFTHSYWVVYFLTPFRLDGLAAGSLLALLLERNTWKVKITSYSGPAFCLSIAFLGAVYASFHSFKRPANSVSFNSIGYSLITFTAASLISYLLLHGTSLASRFMSWRPVSGLGQISYGFYLFHLIAFAFVGQTLHIISHSTKGTFLSLGITLVFSYLSYRFYETPIIRLGHLMAKQRTEPVISAGTRTELAGDS